MNESASESATESTVPSPLVRDVGRWSAHARMWRLTTARRGDGYEAVSCGTQLLELEAIAVRRASRFTSESKMTFFCLPESMKVEAASLDPDSLLRPEAEGESRRFIEHFAEYLEFLGLSPVVRARACIVAPAAASRAIVRPFADPEAGDGDTVISCNLSEVVARVALREEPPRAQGAQGDRPIDRETGNAIAIALEMGDCLIGVRSSILGYVPDEQGEPTFWFESLVRNTRSSVRLP